MERTKSTDPTNPVTRATTRLYKDDKKRGSFANQRKPWYNSNAEETASSQTPAIPKIRKARTPQEAIALKIFTQECVTYLIEPSRSTNEKVKYLEEKNDGCKHSAIKPYLKDLIKIYKHIQNSENKADRLKAKIKEEVKPQKKMPVRQIHTEHLRLYSDEKLRAKQEIENSSIEEKLTRLKEMTTEIKGNNKDIKRKALDDLIVATEMTIDDNDRNSNAQNHASKLLALQAYINDIKNRADHAASDPASVRKVAEEIKDKANIFLRGL